MPPNHPHSDICSSLRHKYVVRNKGKRFSQSQLPPKKESGQRRTEQWQSTDMTESVCSRS